MLALKASLDTTVKLLAAGFALVAIYTAGFGAFDNIWFLAVVVVLGCIISLLRDRGAPKWKRAFDVLVAIVFTGLMWVWLQIMLEQEAFFVDISKFQLVLGWLAFGLVAYATHREFGWPMVLVFLAMGIYVLAPFGAGESWTRISENLWYSTDGVFGLPVQVVSRVVLIFIAFGAVLQASGAGSVLLKMAFAATSRFTGGPAHASIVGSALFGTISGAAIANVVSTGVFTIPIIKRAGFSPKTAGAIEAASSTGGQIMPPVMGVVAFVMADVTGIPYLSIVVAALIPALFYYASLFIVVLIEARKLGIEPTPVDQREKLTPDDWLKSLTLFFPLAVIIYFLTSWAHGAIRRICRADFSLRSELDTVPKFPQAESLVQRFGRCRLDLRHFDGCRDSSRFHYRCHQYDRARLAAIASYPWTVWRQPHGKFAAGDAGMSRHGHGRAVSDRLPRSGARDGAGVEQVGRAHNRGTSLHSIFWSSVDGNAACCVGSFCRRPNSRGQSDGNRSRGDPALFCRIHHPVHVRLLPRFTLDRRVHDFRA